MIEVILKEPVDNLGHRGDVVRVADGYARSTGKPGVAMVTVTITRGGGPISVGVVLGLLFVAVGAGRLYLLRRK